MQEESKVQKLCFKVKALKHNTACIKDSKKNHRTAKLLCKEEFLGSLPQWTIIQHYESQYHHHTQGPSLWRRYFELLILDKKKNHNREDMQ